MCSEYVLQKGGVIYGVTMSKDCYTAEYIRVDSANDLKKLCGSIYLQANLGRTFQSVKKDLENDDVVLFSGTGCYVNGLETFLSKKYDNLICIDVKDCAKICTKNKKTSACFPQNMLMFFLFFPIN